MQPKFISNIQFQLKFSFRSENMSISNPTAEVKKMGVAMQMFPINNITKSHSTAVDQVSNLKISIQINLKEYNYIAQKKTI